MATVSSTLQVKVDSKVFDEFAVKLRTHNKDLKSAGGEWAKLTKAAKRYGDTTTQMVQALFLYNQLMGNINVKQGQSANQVTRSATAWQSISKSVSSVWTTFRTIARWTSLGAIGGGLLGFGGFLGLRGLAGDVSSTRRAALGLGMSFGAQRAFGINFQRFVNANEFLGGINEAILDPSKRAALYMRGVSEADVRRGDTAAISVKVLQDVKRLVDRYPVQLLGTLVQSQRLGELGLDAAALRRIKDTPIGELNEAVGRQARDTQDLAVGKDAQKRWQDFYYQLDRAGKKIETAFIFGLDPIIPYLDELSDDLADTVKSLMGGNSIKDLMGDVKEGLKDFVDYVKSGKLQENAKMFIDDVRDLAAAIHWLVRITGFKGAAAIAGGAYVGGRVAGVPGAAVGAGAGLIFSGIDPKQAALESSDPDSFWWRSRSAGAPFRGLIRQPQLGFNVGGVRMPGGVGFQGYRSLDEGVRAIANTILHGTYFQGHNDTIRNILRVYSPPSENDTHYLIRKMSQRTGLGEDQPLGLANNMDRLATIVSDITRQEGRRFVPKDVVIKILNNTGGNAIVSAANTAR